VTPADFFPAMSTSLCQIIHQAVHTFSNLQCLDMDVGLYAYAETDKCLSIQ
jgi:hypothetical protein